MLRYFSGVWFDVEPETGYKLVDIIRLMEASRDGKVFEMAVTFDQYIKLVLICFLLIMSSKGFCNINASKFNKRFRKQSQFNNF